MENIAATQRPRTSGQDSFQPKIVTARSMQNQPADFNQKQCLLAWDQCTAMVKFDEGLHAQERTKLRTNELSKIFKELTSFDLTLIEVPSMSNLETQGRKFQLLCEFAEEHFVGNSVKISGVEALINRDESMHGLKAFISQNRNLNSVCFDGIPQFAKYYLGWVIVAAIKENDAITELSFKDCGLGNLYRPEKFYQLAEIPSLETLNLENDSVTEERACELIQKCSLSSLNFSGNSYIFSQPVLDALEKNRSLTSFTAVWLDQNMQTQCQAYMNRNFEEQRAAVLSNKLTNLV